MLSRRAAELGVTELGERIADTALRPFLDLMNHPLLHEVCARAYGPRAPVMVFRSEVVTNEPVVGAARHGPWRQNAGQLRDLDCDALVTVLVGLDDAEGSALEVIAGSHRWGLLDSSDGTLSAREAARRCPEDRALPLDLEPGHALLLHKWLVNRSTRTPARRPSRVAGYWFVDGRTRNTRTGYAHLPMLIGDVEREPYPCVRTLERESAALHERLARAEGQAATLARERDRLQAELDRRAGR